MPAPPKLLSLGEIDAIPGPGTLTWLPVRYSLGVRAFGCNAYVAARAGDDVVEPHTEDPTLAHEELYFVARGRAKFTIDGQTHDAAAGTYVFVPDPESHRHAVAEEPGTTVLSFGGPPTFQPSGWEWAFRAAAVRDSDPAEAREILEDGLRSNPDSASLHYESARLDALNGDTDGALSRLRKAIELRPHIARRAREDADFDRIRDEPGFRSLVE